MKTGIVQENQVAVEIKKTISEIARINISDLEDDIKIREELGIDSLMAIEIIAKCEKKFAIVIDETKLESFSTIGDFINYVIGQINKL
jgi:acyl carrier protein